MEDIEAFQGFGFQSFPQKWGIELTKSSGCATKMPSPANPDWVRTSRLSVD
jgi:hypothetical protein